jgi:hypothetical protein
MKKIISFLIIITFLCSCRKHNTGTDYITYDSEIFSGSDTLIYGEWKYLYSIGGIAVHRTDIGISLLSVVPVGDYAFVSKTNSVSKGKILLSGKEWGATAIQFCDNGLNDLEAIRQIINFNGPDTLVLADSGYDMYSHYYKRIK